MNDLIIQLLSLPIGLFLLYYIFIRPWMQWYSTYRDERTQAEWNKSDFRDYARVAHGFFPDVSDDTAKRWIRDCWKNKVDVADVPAHVQHLIKEEERLRYERRLDYLTS